MMQKSASLSMQRARRIWRLFLERVRRQICHLVGHQLRTIPGGGKNHIYCLRCGRWR